MALRHRSWKVGSPFVFHRGDVQHQASPAVARPSCQTLGSSSECKATRSKESRHICSNPSDAARMAVDTRARLRFHVASLFAAASLSARPCRHPRARAKCPTFHHAQRAVRWQAAASEPPAKPEPRGAREHSGSVQGCRRRAARKYEAEVANRRCGAPRFATQALHAWPCLRTRCNEYRSVRLSSLSVGAAIAQPNSALNNHRLKPVG